MAECPSVHPMGHRPESQKAADGPQAPPGASSSTCRHHPIPDTMTALRWTPQGGICPDSRPKLIRRSKSTIHTAPFR
jgi:hypothetical protein